MIGRGITDVEAAIQRARQAIVRETAASPDFMTSGSTLPAYIAAEKARIRALEERMEALRQAYDLQLGRVRQERVEEKRYERLAERRAAKAAREAAEKEQKAIEELVTMGGRRR